MLDKYRLSYEFCTHTQNHTLCMYYVDMRKVQYRKDDNKKRSVSVNQYGHSKFCFADEEEACNAQ